MSTAMVVRDEHPDMGLVLSPVMNIEVAKRRLAEFQEFVRGYLVEGEDFGTIPGTPKPTLLKPGADKLCELYGLADDYEILTQVEQFNSDPPLFDYTIRCRLTSRRDGRLVATGVGSCNSYEGKYKWRDAQRTCPKCHKATIIKGKEEFGGGWLCFAKKGGCGAKFADEDKAIVGQTVGRVLNDDIATQKNTILKMAKKRAKIDATLGATRSSGIFTQDIEDMAAPPADSPSPTQQDANEANAQPRKGRAKASSAPKKETPASGPAKANMPKPDLGKGFVEEVYTTKEDGEALATSKGTEFIKVKQEGRMLYCFHNRKMGERDSLFNLIVLNGKGAFCNFVVQYEKSDKDKKWPAIVGATKIGSQEFLEDGTPVLRRDSAA